MTTAPQSHAPGSRRSPGRTSTVVGIVMVVAGVIVGILATVMFVVPFVNMFTQPIRDVPGEHVIDLGTGDHDVYAQVTFEAAGGLGSTISPREIEITGPDGAPLVVQPSSGRGEIDRDSATYRTVATFEVREAGVHRVVIDSERPGTVIISKTIGNTFGDAAPWLIVAALAALVFLAGVVVLIVGWSRRRRARRAAQQAAYAASPQNQRAWTPTPPGSGSPTPPSPSPTEGASTAPPGWYPDPNHAGTYRYWDGTAWTSDTYDPSASG